MGHSINYFSCANADLNKAMKRYLATAYDPQESSGYHGNMHVHKNIIYLFPKRLYMDNKLQAEFTSTAFLVWLGAKKTL